MSTTTRVLRSFGSTTVTPAGGNAITIVSVMLWSLNDATGEIRTISDNDASYKKFNQAHEFNGTVQFEDPIQAELVRGKNNCAVTFQAVDLNGVGNVNVTMTGTRFGGLGLNLPSGQQGTATLTCSGGLVSAVAA